MSIKLLRRDHFYSKEIRKLDFGTFVPRFVMLGSANLIPYKQTNKQTSYWMLFYEVVF